MLCFFRILAIDRFGACLSNTDQGCILGRLIHWIELAGSMFAAVHSLINALASPGRGIEHAVLLDCYPESLLADRFYTENDPMQALWPKHQLRPEILARK